MSMRKLLLPSLLILLIAPTTARADDKVFGETVKCVVSSVRGSVVSYVPPKVGDKIIINAALSQILELKFGKSMIPLQKPLEKKSHKESASYMVFFKADQDESDAYKSWVTLMVGKFKNAKAVQVYSATIQDVNEDKHSGLISLAEVKLTCQPVH
jgi:hypothetical protein